MDYTVRLHQTHEGGWTASAEGMPGCTVKARSREAVLDEMRTAINLYVQGLLEEAIDQPDDAGADEVVTLSV